MLFFKRKQRISSDELAQKLALAFSAGIEQEFLDRAQISWIWKALPQADPKAVIKEWATVQMFLRSLAFRTHLQNSDIAETVLDYFHGHAWRELIQKRLLDEETDAGSFLRQRYANYSRSMAGSKQLNFQLTRVAEEFFRLCGGTVSIEAVLATTTCFVYALIAEKNLIVKLQKDVTIVS